jgi:predicted PurR-regulated permease PerM
MKGGKELNQLIIIGLVLGLFLLSFLVLKPILIPIIFALLFAYVFHPLYDKIYNRLKKPNLSAAILMFILAIIVAVPLIYFTPLLVRQIFNIYVFSQNMDLVGLIQQNFPNLFTAETAGIVNQINTAVGKIITQFMQQFTGILERGFDLILKFVVFFFTFYLALRDSDKLGAYISKISPFSRDTDKKFRREFRGITNSIMIGQVFIGVLQGLMLGLGLWLLGVSNVITLIVLTILVSIIPILGSWLIWFPVTIALFFSGEITSSLILFCYSVLFVSSIDNFVRPYLLSKSSDLPLAISLIGTIGGLYFMGIVGLILGPLILAYSLIILDLYQKGKLNELGKE